MTWYSLEILYDGETPGSVEKHNILNLDGPGMMKARESLFYAGLFVRDPEHPATEGEVISPYRIRKIKVFMQSKKF